VVNLVMYGKVVWCSEKFCGSWKFFGPLQRYTDRNFFGDGGGWRSPKLISSTNIFFGTGRAQSEKVEQISFRPPNFFLPVRPCKHQSIHSYTCSIPIYLYYYAFVAYLKIINISCKKKRNVGHFEVHIY
jgi:hypothetical protein